MVKPQRQELEQLITPQSRAERNEFAYAAYPSCLPVCLACLSFLPTCLPILPVCLFCLSVCLSHLSVCLSCLLAGFLSESSLSLLLFCPEPKAQE